MIYFLFKRWNYIFIYISVSKPNHLSADVTIFFIVGTSLFPPQHYSPFFPPASPISPFLQPFLNSLPLWEPTLTAQHLVKIYLNSYQFLTAPSRTPLFRSTYFLVQIFGALFSLALFFVQSIRRPQELLYVNTDVTFLLPYNTEFLNWRFWKGKIQLRPTLFLLHSAGHLSQFSTLSGLIMTWWDLL